MSLSEIKKAVKAVSGIHAKIAADLCKDGKRHMLQCERCNERVPLSEEDLARYLKRGWPEHCYRTMQWVTLLLLLSVLPAGANDTCSRLIARQFGAVNVADNHLANLARSDWDDCILRNSGCSNMVALVRTSSLALSSVCRERGEFLNLCPDDAMTVEEQARTSLLRQRWTRSLLRIEEMQAALFAAMGAQFDHGLDYCRVPSGGQS